MVRCPERGESQGITLVELVIIIVIGGVLFAATTPLVFHGVKTMVFLPNALSANRTATGIVEQVVEGGPPVLEEVEPVVAEFLVLFHQPWWLVPDFPHGTSPLSC